MTQIKLAGTEHKVELMKHPDGTRLWVDGKAYEANQVNHADGRQEIILNGKAYPVHVIQNGSTAYIHAFGKSWEVNVPDAADASDANDGGKSLFAPMPGTVIDLRVTPKQKVARGQTLLVIESMKMQTEITAECDGQVAEIRVKPGQTFNRGDLFIRLENQEK